MARPLLRREVVSRSSRPSVRHRSTVSDTVSRQHSFAARSLRAITAGPFDQIKRVRWYRAVRKRRTTSADCVPAHTREPSHRTSVKPPVWSWVPRLSKLVLQQSKERDAACGTLFTRALLSVKQLSNQCLGIDIHGAGSQQDQLPLEGGLGTLMTNKDKGDWVQGTSA